MVDKIHNVINDFINKSNIIMNELIKKYELDGREYRIVIYCLSLAFVEDCLRNNKLESTKKEYLKFKQDFKEDILSAIQDFEQNEEKNPFKGEKTYLFSKELRDKLSKYKHLTPKEALNNKDFMNDLLNHAGVSESKIDELLNFMNK